MELVEREVAGLGGLGHVRPTRGVADGDVHEEVPAVLSQVRNEQVGPLPVVASIPASRCTQIAQ